MRNTMQDTRQETRPDAMRDTMREVTRRTIRGGGKLVSGSVMASVAILARTLSAGVDEGAPTAILTWVVFGIGLILVIWGIFERVET